MKRSVLSVDIFPLEYSLNYNIQNLKSGYSKVIKNVHVIGVAQFHAYLNFKGDSTATIKFNS